MRPVTPKEWRDVYYLVCNAADDAFYGGQPHLVTRYERIAEKIKEQHYVTKETP